MSAGLAECSASSGLSAAVRGSVRGSVPHATTKQTQRKAVIALPSAQWGETCEGLCAHLLLTLCVALVCCVQWCSAHAPLHAPLHLPQLRLSSLPEHVERCSDANCQWRHGLGLGQACDRCCLCCPASSQRGGAAGAAGSTGQDDIRKRTRALKILDAEIEKAEEENSAGSVASSPALLSKKQRALELQIKLAQDKIRKVELQLLTAATPEDKAALQADKAALQKKEILLLEAQQQRAQPSSACMTKHSHVSGCVERSTRVLTAARCSPVSCVMPVLHRSGGHGRNECAVG